MNKDFDIVWYQAEHAKEAIRSLVLIPDKERQRRGITHPFRMIRKAPIPNTQGMIKGRGYCVWTDRLGAESLHPGQEGDGRVLITDLCRELVEVKPGFIGGYFKDEVWNTPEVIESAKERAKTEEKNLEVIAKAREEKAQAYNAALETAEDSYFRTAARLVLRRGRVEPSELQPDELRRVVLMGAMAGVEMPDLADWLALAMKDVLKPDSEAERGEYDPVSFLEYAEQMANLGRR
jgi:hypothetical protein